LPIDDGAVNRAGHRAERTFRRPYSVGLDGASRASASITAPMPKMKTHSGAKKRFRLTAKGKVRARHAMRSHMLGKKSAKRKARLERPKHLAPGDARRAKDLLGE
jgi:large subunit ribosomal protein L35